MDLQANELRIGNLVKIPRKKNGEYYDKIVSLNAISTGTFSINEDGKHLVAVEREINPIPITEEILLKAGFDEESEKPINYSANLYVDMVSNEACVGCEYDGFHLVRSNLKYVHQLQNLYFALTGEELEIDLC